MPLDPCVENSASCTPCTIVWSTFGGIIALCVGLAVWHHYGVSAHIKSWGARRYGEIKEWSDKHENHPGWAYGLAMTLGVLMAIWVCSLIFIDS